MAFARILVLAGKAFRGVQHFQSQSYDASTEAAKHAVESGVAVWNIDSMTPNQLNDWYEEVVGYRPQVDDSSMSDVELLDLCHSYLSETAL